MSGNFVSTAFGFLIGIVMQIVPGLNEKWEAWSWRKLVELGSSFVISFAAMALVCYAGAPLGFECIPLNSWAGIWCCIQAGLAGWGAFGIGEAGRVTVGAAKAFIARLRSRLRARRQARRARRQAKRQARRAKRGKLR